jgi:FMN phosphatase YigB (HAD superfamily)
LVNRHIDVVFFDLGNTLVTGQRKWVPGAKDAVETLGSAGVRLGVISNTGQLTRQQVIELLPTDFDMDIFEDELIILSKEVGVEKPAAQIFGIAVDRAEVGPQSIIFCGESLSEVLAAQCIGIFGLQAAVSSDTSGTVVRSNVAQIAEQIVALNGGN